jgi:hypothetical protein
MSTPSWLGLRVALLVIVGALSACETVPSTPPADGSVDLPGVDLAIDTGVDAAAPDVEIVSDQAAPDIEPDQSLGGEIMALTYNVAGLPFGVSKSDPDKNTPLISPLLNPYDLVLMQEDFSYTKQLSSAANHPYKTTPAVPPAGKLVNDGLTMFSNFPFSNFNRQMWIKCFGIIDHGSDCLSAKGFSVAEVELAKGVTVDVYNLHMDAGSDVPDYDARVAQVDQLLKEIASRSAGRAVIVAGDTNLKFNKPGIDNEGLLDKLLKSGGLTDACRALSCAEDGRIDRIFYRSSSQLELEALSWAVDSGFVDKDGKDLSDHKAVGVRISWKVVAPGGSG